MPLPNFQPFFVHPNLAVDLSLLQFLGHNVLPHFLHRIRWEGFHERLDLGNEELLTTCAPTPEGLVVGLPFPNFPNSSRR